ncbi:MAG: RMD1 family protein [Thermosediminibacteraceae bacterium]|nr:RMD1 family protein [Thermosediminibacteraceae bacterium]
MKSIKLLATSLCNEININRLSNHFGINKKHQWDEPLVLSEEQLKGILRLPEGKLAYIFSFGSMVFLDFEHHEIMDLLEYLKKIDKNLMPVSSLDYSDDYTVMINSGQEFSVSNECTVIPKVGEMYLEIIATVLAKSVALSRIEDQIDDLMDAVEDVINYLETGRLNISDEKLARMSGKILGFKYNTLSHIMLLDKPEITWINEESENLYIALEEQFELGDRYEKIRHKTETLLDITEVFTSLVHAKRGTRLEWMIIFLIAFEIVLSIVMSLLGIY